MQTAVFELFGICGLLVQTIILRYMLKWLGETRVLIVGLCSAGLEMLVVGLLTAKWQVPVPRPPLPRVCTHVRLGRPQLRRCPSLHPAGSAPLLHLRLMSQSQAVLLFHRRSGPLPWAPWEAWCGFQPPPWVGSFDCECGMTVMTRRLTVVA